MFAISKEGISNPAKYGAQPIAMVFSKNADLDANILYVGTTKLAEIADAQPPKIRPDELCTGRNPPSQARYRQICARLEESLEDSDSDDALERRAKALARERAGREISLPPGAQFGIIPPPKKDDQRTYIIFHGSSDVGKSYTCAAYAEMYAAQHLDRKIYLLSPKDEDKAYAHLEKMGRVTRLNINDLMGKPTLENKDYARSLFIYDDCEALEEKKRKKVEAMRDAQILTGRSFGIDIAECLHRLCDGQRTRAQLLEVEYLVFFRDSSRHHNNYVLENYLRFDRKMINRILNSPSRWTLVRAKGGPQYCLGETEAWII